MQCDRCGETMRPETVIQLRRSFGRVRATHRQGGYCANCGISAPVEVAGRKAPQAAQAAWMRLAVRAAHPPYRDRGMSAGVDAGRQSSAWRFTSIVNPTAGSVSNST